MMHIFHDWTKWSKTREATLSRWVGGVPGGIKEEYYAKIQSRTCSGCGKYQWRQV